MRQSFHLVLFFTIFIPLFTGCSTPPARALVSLNALEAWSYTDLRLYDPVDSISPESDIIALYTRLVGNDFQIRLDLLDSTPIRDSDIYLSLDYLPGGSDQLPFTGLSDTEWDSLISIPASGPIQAFAPDGQIQTGLGIHILRDPVLDTFVLGLRHDSLPGAGKNIQVQAFLTPSGENELADQIGPVYSNSSPPPPVPVILAFWNTFNAATPAQALRRWNGAHTGPASERHGLDNLLRAVTEKQFPVVLLDLKRPESLSALDYLGAIPMIQNLAKQELLVLPDIIPLPLHEEANPASPPAWAAWQGANEARNASRAFQLPNTTYLYSAQMPAEVQFSSWDGYQLLFVNAPRTSTNDASGDVEPEPGETPLLGYISRWKQLRVITLPYAGAANDSEFIPADAIQATEDGPSLRLRQDLANTAFSQARKEAANNRYDPGIILLGGDLSQSYWGDYRSASQTMEYLLAHPWVQPLKASDLIGDSTGHQSFIQPGRPVASSVRDYVPYTPLETPILSGLTTAEIQQALLGQLAEAPQSDLTKTAWQAYWSLFAPVVQEAPELYPLRGNYLGQTGHFLAAARWEENPESVSNGCQKDIDWDGEVECVLASNDVFSVFETAGGYATVIFVRTVNGVHQVVGPSSQFFVGLSDPSMWKPERGVAGDSAQLRGAFSDLPLGYANPTWETWQSKITAGEIVFTSPDGNLQKTFRIIPGGIHAQYSTPGAYRVQIPLALDPWLRFNPGWGDLYQAASTSSNFLWGLKSGPSISVTTTGTLTGYPFNESRPVMTSPENPNYDYPLGHFIPFPLAFVEVKAEGEFEITITVTGP